MFAQGEDVTRTFLPLGSLLAVLVLLPSAGCSASDGRLAPSAEAPPIAAQPAADAPPPRRRMFDPGPINALLAKRPPGQTHPVWQVSFRNQIQRCLKMPSESLAIDVEIKLRPDGALAADPLLLHQSDAVDHPEATASVLGAIKACAPFRLPPEQYASWSTIETTFDGLMK